MIILAFSIPFRVEEREKLWFRRWKNKWNPERSVHYRGGRYAHANLERVTSSVTRGTMRQGCQIPCCVLWCPSLDHLNRPKTYNWKYPALEEKLQVSENVSRQSMLLQIPSWGEEGDVLGQNPKLMIFSLTFEENRSSTPLVQPRAAGLLHPVIEAAAPPPQPSVFRFCPVNQEPQGMHNLRLPGTADLGIFFCAFSHCMFWAPEVAEALAGNSPGVPPLPSFVWCTTGAVLWRHTSTELISKRCQGKVWKKGIVLLCDF